MGHFVSVELVDFQEVADEGGDVAFVVGQDLLLFRDLVEGQVQKSFLLYYFALDVTANCICESIAYH